MFDSPRHCQLVSWTPSHCQLPKAPCHCQLPKAPCHCQLAWVPCRAPCHCQLALGHCQLSWVPCKAPWHCQLALDHCQVDVCTVCHCQVSSVPSCCQSVFRHDVSSVSGHCQLTRSVPVVTSTLPVPTMTSASCVARDHVHDNWQT